MQISAEGEGQHEYVTEKNFSLTASDNISDSKGVPDKQIGEVLSTITEQEQEARNIQSVRQLRDALNTGNVSNVDEFISPNYFNHES